MNDFLSFFFRYISFFRYLFIILWMILFFDIPLLHYYFNLSSLLFQPQFIITLLFQPNFLSLFWTYMSLFCCESFETFVILLAILLPIKLPVPSAIFWITLFDEVLETSVADFLAWSRSFGSIYHLVLLDAITNVFVHNFSKRQKSITFTNLLSLGSPYFIYYISINN